MVDDTIYNESHYQDMLKLAEILMEVNEIYDDPSSKERLISVTAAIEQYERKHYPIGKPSLYWRIRFRIDQMIHRN